MKNNNLLTLASQFLSQYPLEVHHIPGAFNVLADSLSRLPSRAVAEAGKGELDQIWEDDIFLSHAVQYSEAIAQPGLVDDIKAGYREDKRWADVLEQLGEDGRAKGLSFVRIDGLLYLEDEHGRRRLCLPSKVAETFIQDEHLRNLHPGQRRMWEEISASFAVPRLMKKINQVVNSCEACQRNQADRQAPPGELVPIQSPAIPFHTIAMDFVTGLPTVPSENLPWLQPAGMFFNSLLTVTDKFSKMCILIPGHEVFTAEEWAWRLFHELMRCNWGIPKRIISDRDPKFVSEFWRELWTAFGSKLLLSTAYHPQTDGLSEKRNQTVETALRYFVTDFPEKRWVEALPAIQFQLNNAYAAVIKTSPSELLTGSRMNDGLRHLGDQASRNSREFLRDEAALSIACAQSAMKKRYDGKHRKLEFKTGDWVWLRLGKGYKVADGRPAKLAEKKTGPFKILERIGHEAYRLDLDGSLNIHPVVSVTQLRPAEPPEARPGAEPGTDQWEVDRILDVRQRKRGRGKARTEFLISWKGWPSNYNTWVAETDFNAPELIKEFRQQRQEMEERVKATKEARAKQMEGYRPPEPGEKTFLTPLDTSHQVLPRPLCHSPFHRLDSVIPPLRQPSFLIIFGTSATLASTSILRFFPACLCIIRVYLSSLPRLFPLADPPRMPLKVPDHAEQLQHPSSDPRRSRDKEFRAAFYDQLKRQPPVLTYEGLRRALELYGNEAELHRKLRSVPTRYALWKRNHPTLFARWKKDLENDGYDLVRGRSNGYYFWISNGNDDDGNTSEESIESLPSAASLTPRRQQARLPFTPSTRPTPTRTRQLSNVLSAIKEEMPVNTRSGKDKTGLRVPLPDSFKALTGNVTPQPRETGANYYGAVSLLDIAADALRAVITGKVKENTPAFKEIVKISDALDSKECVPAFLKNAEKAMEHEQGKDESTPTLFGRTVKRVATEAVDLTDDRTTRFLPVVTAKESSDLATSWAKALAKKNKPSIPSTMTNSFKYSIFKIGVHKYDSTSCAVIYAGFEAMLFGDEEAAQVWANLFYDVRRKIAPNLSLSGCAKLCGVPDDMVIDILPAIHLLDDGPELRANVESVKQIPALDNAEGAVALTSQLVEQFNERGWTFTIPKPIIEKPQHWRPTMPASPSHHVFSSAYMVHSGGTTELNARGIGMVDASAMRDSHKSNLRTEQLGIDENGNGSEDPTCNVPLWQTEDQGEE
ncbi:hypothetical protein XA68_18403 [Ophiocordyceps unilateralis]|uniref:Chromo domain-containing protein n=1 Tax=Ophiocordyceps unilateralis TaxID=268505 RepID=A0A2A9P3G2_OPHUN|nr:hypothetical protein XA68_18403 [Ophiocordyceps unilateralis]